MSRIGNKPIEVPNGVNVTVDGQKVVVKGPKGTLERIVTEPIKVELKENIITVKRPNDNPQNRSLHGLTRTLINNMVLTLGYSHPVEIDAPAGITFDVPSQTEIIVKGIDKELVGQTAAVIRTKRPPEVYKGKGIKYADEVIRRKEGKAGKK